MHPRILVLAATLAAGAAASLYAQQEIKPRPDGASPTERLRAPAKVTAVQEPTGAIRVVWSAVAGATRYSMTRSVPPAGATAVSLPSSADTVYIDRDVTPGSTYYYLVGAINEAGITGMRASAPPIKAEARAADQPTEAPRGVTAVLNGPYAVVSWGAMRSVNGYIVERSVVTENRTPSWIRVAERVGCCNFRDHLNAVPPGARLRYRVSAVSPTFLTSPPGISNEITLAASADTTGGQAAGTDTTGQQPADSAADRQPADTAVETASGDTSTTASSRTNVRPAVIGPATRLKVGESLDLRRSSSFKNLKLRNPRWISLNESRATVNSRGVVQGHAVGTAHIIAIGTAADGSIASLVQPVDVRRR